MFLFLFFPSKYLFKNKKFTQEGRLGQKKVDVPHTNIYIYASILHIFKKRKREREREYKMTHCRLYQTMPLTLRISVITVVTQLLSSWSDKEIKSV